jgi:hypothetical protein
MKEDMEKKNTYVSRSLAHIGHILIKRSNILDRMNTDYKFLKDKSYLEFHENPMIPLEKAYKMQMGSPVYSRLLQCNMTMHFYMVICHTWLELFQNF